MLINNAKPPCYTKTINTIKNLSLFALNTAIRISKTLNIELVIPQEFRVVELSEEELEEIKGYSYIRGEYLPENKTLYLQKGQWCIPTLVHELLHAGSYFSWEKELAELSDKIYAFIESLTEFLTGFILYKEYPTCYLNWINKYSEICRVETFYEKD